MQFFHNISSHPLNFPENFTLSCCFLCSECTHDGCSWCADKCVDKAQCGKFLTYGDSEMLTIGILIVVGALFTVPLIPYSYYNIFSFISTLLLNKIARIMSLLIEKTSVLYSNYI